MKSLNEVKQDGLKKTQEVFAPYIEQIEKDFYKVFPNGFINIGIERVVGSPYLYIGFGLIGDKKDQSHGIVENDPMHHKMIGHFASNDYYAEHSIDEKIELESLISGIMVEPTEKYLAMSRVKTSFRKSTAPIAKQVPKLKKYFSEIGQLVLDNKDKLYKKDIKEKYLDIKP